MFKYIRIMKRISREQTDEIIKELQQLGQHHLIDQLDLSPDHPIINQLRDLDLSASLKHFESARAATVSNDRGISPVEKVFDWAATELDAKSRIEAVGEDALRKGKIAAVIMSGGQGTRLGFAGPKGMYDMGLSSKRTIFQLHIDRIKRVKQLVSDGTSSASIPIYIMTSDLNDKTIREYFNSIDYFGYPKEDIFFFQQGVEPCLLVPKTSVPPLHHSPIRRKTSIPSGKHVAILARIYYNATGLVAASR